jgi:hypothetical protein
MNARFRIIGRLDRAHMQQGTVTIYREAGVFSVRPHARRREYLFPLATLAEIVVARVIKAELAEKRAAKKARRAKGRV